MPSAAIGFLVGITVLSLTDEPFWPSRLPSAYVKVTFTMVIGAMATALWLESRSPIIERRATMPPTHRARTLVIVVLFAGGVVSSLTGSGADVFLYVVIAVIFGVSPAVAVPSSVVVMAVVSWLGMAVLAGFGGQLDVAVVGDQVTAVDGRPVGPVADGIAYDTPTVGVDAGRYDLFGLWLAAVPFVAWGAPLGAWLASKASDRGLVRFVTALAFLEVATTAIFLSDLRENMALLATFVGGFAATVGLLVLARRHRRFLSGLPAPSTIGGDVIDATEGLSDALGHESSPPGSAP